MLDCWLLVTLFLLPRLISILCLDANTVGSIASVASIDWGCAVQVMAAASIGSGGTFQATDAQLLYERLSHLPQSSDTSCSGVYAAIILTHAVICCLATPVLARLQSLYIVLNVLCVLLHQFFNGLTSL